MPPRAIGRRVEVRVDLDEVTVTLGREVIATHRRSLAKHRTITDPAHVAEREALRARRRHEQRRPKTMTSVEVRDLAVYDRALGVA